MSDLSANQPTLLERMRLLEKQGEERVRDLRARQQHLEAEVARYFPAGEVKARVSLAENGFIEHLSVESASREVAAADYLQAINAAILLAQADKPTLPIEATQALVEDLSRGEAPPSISVSDDFSQITVIAAFGDIRGVHAKARWLETSSDDLIAEEILRVAQQAAKESDRFGRFA